MWWFECRFRHFCFLLPVIHSLTNPLKQSKIFRIFFFFLCLSRFSESQNTKHPRQAVTHQTSLLFLGECVMLSSNLAICLSFHWQFYIWGSLWMCMKVVAIHIDAFYSSYSTRFLLRIFLSALWQLHCCLSNSEENPLLCCGGNWSGFACCQLFTFRFM